MASKIINTYYEKEDNHHRPVLANRHTTECQPGNKQHYAPYDNSWQCIFNFSQFLLIMVNLEMSASEYQLNVYDLLVSLWIWKPMQWLTGYHFTALQLYISLGVEITNNRENKKKLQNQVDICS